MDCVFPCFPYYLESCQMSGVNMSPARTHMSFASAGQLTITVASSGSPGKLYQNKWLERALDPIIRIP
jgi:hypothetical protein